MAFDQNSIPQDLRPLNIVRNAVEDPRIAPIPVSGRPIEGFYANPPRDAVSPNSIPAVYYPAETGLVGLGFTTNAAVPVPGVAGWVPRVAPSPPSAIVATPTPAPVVNSGGGGSSHNAAFGARLPGTSASDQVTDENTEDSVSGRKVKFMCSFGGKILPRPSDGALRYVGGQTRIISVRKNVSFGELVQKMVDAYGQNVVIKYQLPEEDLDALVSVSCPDDLENMMDEYEKLLERSPDGSAKLRVFLFSASEVDSAGMVPIGDWHDGGQKYVEAVNGYIDGSGSGSHRGVISRKESTASSAHSSDVNGTEIVDSRSHAEIIVPTSTSVPSSSENFIASQEAATSMVVVDPSHAVQFDASTSPVAVSNSDHPPLSAQCENELEIPPSIGGQQQQVDPELTQAARTVPATLPYLQPYIDPRQDTIPRGDYVRPPAQLGFPTQLLGHVTPMFPQTHIASGASHQQFIPAVHMTMVPSSHVSMNPNLVQSLVQPQQIRLEPYSPESSLGQRVIHVPAGQGYKPYHAPLPPAVLGGAYSWHQVPPTEQVTHSEGYVPHHQQAMAAEKIARFDDCLMCQKALPHAHSDTVAQDQRESPASTISDSRSIYHSLRLDDIGRPISRPFVPGVLGEPMVENAATGSQSRVWGNINHDVGNLQSDRNGLQQNVEGHYEKDRVILQKAAENSEFSKLPVQHGIGVTGGIPSPYGVFVGNFPQSSRDNVVQTVLNPTQYQIKQDSVISKPTISDIPTFGGAGFQPLDHLVDESPKDSSVNTPTTAPLEDNMKSHAIHEHLRQIDGRMENLWVSPSEILTINEQNKPPNDISKVEDILENRQHVGGETYSNESSYMHNLQATESYEVAQSHLVNPGACNTHSKFGVNLVADDTSHNTGFSGVDSMHTTERVAPIGEKRDNAPRFQPNMVSTGVEAFLLDGNTSSVSPSNRIGDLHDNTNSLFSNQDPWNLRHDSHFPPPRPSKIQLKKETLKDLSGENRPEKNGDLLSGNNIGLIAEIQLDDGVSQAFCNLNTDSSLEHPETNNGSVEDQIKQELQAVAEGVAASVLQSSSLSNADSSGHGRNDSPMNQQISEVQNIDRGMQNVDKYDEIKEKMPEKTNIGFPVSDGLGRLQIIKNSDLEELQELGSGTFGTVYHGKWRGTDVAIKRINDRCFAGKPSEQERMREDFWNEAIKLADLHHPNVVAFYGVVLDGPGSSVATVTEYMVNGSLRTALQKSERNLDKRKRLLIAMDVAFGMEYLHGKNIVHFDLKSDNLLVNLRDPHRPICKVGDLGLSKVKCQTLISGGVRGTLPWMAPELLNGSSSLVSEKVDVYSFGIVMWELLTGEEPYADLHYGAIIGGIVSNTLRPPVPEPCDPEWKSLMEWCWAAEPSERPSFTEIANELRSMASKIPPKGQNHQQPQFSKQPQVKS